MKITLEINDPGMLLAIAKVIQPYHKTVTVPESAVVPAPKTTPTSEAAPAPVATPAPAPAATPAPVVPTTHVAETYTLDQLQQTAARLNDTGKTTDLLNLIKSFGVVSLTQLPAEQYGAFAVGLKQLGGQL